MSEPDVLLRQEVPVHSKVKELELTSKLVEWVRQVVVPAALRGKHYPSPCKVTQQLLVRSCHGKTSVHRREIVFAKYRVRNITTFPSRYTPGIKTTWPLRNATTSIGLLGVSICRSARIPQFLSQSTQRIQDLLKHKHYLHSSDKVLWVASDMEPCARVHQWWIPTLQHLKRIDERLSQSMKSVTCIWK